MFKQGSVENEIYRSMEADLIKSQAEQERGSGKIAKAIDLLHAAANIFDLAGMQEEADDLTKILETLR